MDWNDATHRSGLYRIGGKTWQQDVDKERGNYDYLMGADVDTDNPTVREEREPLGALVHRHHGVDGFRLDAVKHISASFYKAWLADMRAYAGRELFAVGEYWHQDVNVLLDYLGKVDFSMSLFDVPLHQHFHEISRGNGQFDMSRLFEGTLVGARPDLAVTFVDNHDTQPGQSLQSWVDGWFKAAAYGLILLRAYGYPCVFYGDLYGIPSRRIGAVSEPGTASQGTPLQRLWRGAGLLRPSQHHRFHARRPAHLSRQRTGFSLLGWSGRTKADVCGHVLCRHHLPLRAGRAAERGH